MPGFWTRNISCANGLTGNIRAASSSAIVLCLITLLTLPLSCSKPPVETEPVARPIKSLVVGGIAAAGGRTYPGTVRGVEEVNMSFRVSGPLIEFPVERGAQVVKNDLLAKLDPRDYKTAVQKAKAEFRQASEEYRRTQELYIQDYVSRSELDLRRSERDVAKAKLTDAEDALRDTELRAPFAGRVIQKFVENFETVQAKEPIVRLIDVTQLEVVINIPESDIAMDREAPDIEEAAQHLKAEVEFASFPGRRFPITLKEAELEADPKTQTFTLKFLLPTPEEMNILPGMTSTVYLESDNQALQLAGSTFLVPPHAVFANEMGQQFVWVIDNETMTAQLREVSVGTLSGNAVEVTNGLTSGERIATAGITQLKEGMKVRPMDADVEFQMDAESINPNE